MHNHVANRGRKALLKQIFSVFLIFTIYFNAFNSAFASASDLGGWTITSKVAQGASTLINASKTVLINGANIAKTSTAIIKPTVPQVTKLILRGAGGYALSIAVEQLIGAVDWVLDPANSQILYKDPDQPLKNMPKAWSYYVVENGTAVKKFANSAKNACTAVADYYNSDGLEGVSFKSVQINGDSAKCRYNNFNNVDTIYYENNPFYAPNTQQDQKKLPLDVVAQKIIDNAETGDSHSKAPSQTVTVGAVEDALANDSATKSNVINQLETNAKTETKEDAKGDTKPKDPTKPELGDEFSLKFPVFCSWAPVVCEAAQTAISFPQTLTSWWDLTKQKYDAAVTSITDFFKNEPDNSDSDNDLPVQDTPLPQLNTGTFKATPGCPAPIPINITIGTKGTGQISYEPICQFASKWSFVAPLIGFLSGAMILVGVGRKGEDGEI